MAVDFLFSFFLNRGTPAESSQRKGSETSQEEVGAHSLLNDGELPGSLSTVPAAGAVRLLPAGKGGAFHQLLTLDREGFKQSGV